MSASNNKYTFQSKPWQHSGPGGWHFVSLPEKMSATIRKESKWEEEGWGRLKAKAKIGKTEWMTAIWYDSKRKTYLLPLKVDVRKKENIKFDEMLEVSLWV